MRQLCAWGKERPNLQHDFGYVSTGPERLTAVRDWRRLMRKSIPNSQYGRHYPLRAKSSVIVEQ